MKIYGLTGTKNDGVLMPAQQKALDKRQGICVKSVTDFWEAGRDSGTHPEIAMPTGFGKGRVVHRLLKRTKHEKVLAIVGTKNILLDQSHDVLAELAIMDTGDADFSILPDLSGRVVLATWQGLGSFAKRTKQKPEFGLAVVDEVHNIGTRRRLDLLDWLKPDEVVGLTATAYRAHGEFRTPEDYGFTVVDSMPLPECINKRWLSPLMGVSIDTQVMLPQDVRQGGHLNQRKIAKALRRYPHLFRNIANDIAERFVCTGMKTVIVVNRVQEEACLIAKELTRRGFKVGLAVNQRAARELSYEFITLDAIQRYKLPHNHPDAIQILISPQVIGEGFDAPATECVIWAAPTLSHVRYTQVIGRGSRRCWKKKYCLIVDYVYNIDEYGYSYNFAQFFRKEDLKELEGGFMYVGPEEIGSTIKLPSEFSKGRRIVSVVDLRTPVYLPAGDWLTIPHLEEEVGKSRLWLMPRLEQWKSLAELRRSRKGATLHYPPSVVGDLKRMAEEVVDCGEEWLSIRQITQRVKKSGMWVKKRIPRFSHLASQRVGLNAKVSPHYPLSVLEDLHTEAKALPPKPEVGWRTAASLHEETGRSYQWLKRWFEQHFPNAVQTYLDPLGSPSPHYSPAAVSALKRELAQTSNADGWLTANEIADLIQCSYMWTARRLEQSFSKTGEIRRGANNKPFLHYPRSAVKAMLKMAKEVILAGTWLSSVEVAEKLGETETRVNPRLKKHFSRVGEMRVGRARRPTLHYPPSVVQQIKKYL